ncbi:NUDIX hydrolase [Micromonospora sp. LAH09]|uniref:NUDIX hydrolase n=1 Tax=Micromonospora cabrerizensis TaxID=2911213 RepID=UPI001EE83187|nr:NUDIX hydrolase [Micromonospora cabrerizensis]MCG5470999.1 NUDIX hydrolase [Micromonospora cabrerizensis]
MSALTWAVAAVVSDDTGRVLLCRQGRGERRHALPGGRLRPAESPVRAALRDIRAETGWEIELVDLVGVYHLGGPTGQASPGRAGPLPDVLVHVFRARAADRRPTTDPLPGCRLSWHSPDALPTSVTPLTRAAVTDAMAGRSGVLRDVRWAPGAVDAAPAARPVDEGRRATAPGGRPGTGQDGRPGTSLDGRTGQDGRPGAGQPPEQRGEPVDPSLRP